MKICFATEVTYLNYVNRIKLSSLKCFLDSGLDQFDIHYYISTNLPENFREFSENQKIKVFDIDQLRINNEESKKYELFPEDPVGLYPSKYPWNSRRFIIEQAAKDGFDYILYIDADTVFKSDLTPIQIYTQIVSAHEPNTVKTNSTIFKYVNKAPEDVFNFHNDYIKHFNLSFSDDDYDTIDGPCQVFIGSSSEDILRLTSIWNDFTIFGYKKEFGFGYGNNKHGNLSFVIPLSGFKLKWNSFPFYPNHVFEDRYTHKSNNFSSKKDSVVTSNNSLETNDNKSIRDFFIKFSSDKIESGYDLIYDSFFKKIKNDYVKILEIGVGTVSKTPLEGMSCVPSTMYGWKENNVNYQPGASLRAYRDYFINGEIYGVDIQPDCLINENRLKTYLFSSDNKEKCDEFFEDSFFDIIIDDGDHNPTSQIKTFTNLYPKLKENGFYFIEDVIDFNQILDFFEKNNIEYCVYDRAILSVEKKNGSVIKLPSVVSEKTEIKNVKIVNYENYINDETYFKINGLKFADRGFFINLPSSADRLKLVKDQIIKYDISGLNRFEALTDEMRQFSCTKSHLKVFEVSLIEDFEIIFVSEDDFLIEDLCYYPIGDKKYFFDVISLIHEDLKNVEWDVLLFGCNPKAPLIPITDNLALVHQSTGAWAYLIKKRAYRYLLKNLNYKKDLIAIDDFLPILNSRGFITLTTIPLTINHGVGLVSTLQPAGPVNYDAWIKGSYHKHFYDIINKTINVLAQNTTIVIFGHFVDDFLFYLRYLLFSLPHNLKTCKIIINYDYSDLNTLNSGKIQISAFFRDVMPGMNVTVEYSYGGLISSINNIIDKIKTPYFIFLEHDWVFLSKNSIDFINLITAFNKYSFLNAVWFSKDDNILRGFEITEDFDGTTTPFKLEDRVSECDLITTCRWSNNPAIFRLSKFKEWFTNIIINEHVGKVNQGSHNVEETIIPYYRNIIKEKGWENIKDEWGTYLYGNINEGPYVGHTDASKRYQGHNKSQPEINGEEYIKNNPL